MTAFVIIYFGILIGASCVAAVYKHKSALILLFGLTCLSLVGVLVGGSGLLITISIIAGLFAASAGLAFSFRETLVLILPQESARLMRTAPLTAAFGLLVILGYLIAAVFAPVIAPFGESEIVGSSFAPPDDIMLLGGD